MNDLEKAFDDLNKKLESINERLDKLVEDGERNLDTMRANVRLAKGRRAHADPLMKAWRDGFEPILKGLAK